MKKTKTFQSANSPSLSQLKSQKKHPSTPTIKKKTLKQSPSSTKHKQQPIKKPHQPQDYIIINDNIYSANTFTQRNSYEQFLHKVKKEKQIQRKSFLVKSQINEENSGLKKSRQNSRKDKMWKNLSPQDFIQTMSLQEKKQMFFKLQQQIRAANAYKSAKCQQFVPQSFYMAKNSQPCSTQSFQNDLSQRKRLYSQRQRKEKFSLIEQKLQNLKMQLMFKWQGQIDRLEQMQRKEKITQKQKQTKIVIIQKLKDHKLKILDCTKSLFQKILREEQYEQHHSEQKVNKIQAILQSLHSFPSIQSLDEHYLQKQPNIDHLKAKSPEKGQISISPKKNFNIDSSPLQIFQDNTHQAFLNEFKEESWQNNITNIKTGQYKQQQHVFHNISPKKGRFAQCEDNPIEVIQTSELNYYIPNSQHQNPSQQLFHTQKPLFTQTTQKISLKLDLRLDQVVFGQDEYPQCQKNQQKHPQHLEQEQPDNLQTIQRLSHDNFRQSSNLQQSLQIKGISVQTQAKIQPEQYEQQNLTESLNPISPVKVEKISMSKISLSSLSSIQQNQDDLSCKQQPPQKMNINIPMILSRQKMQTLAFEQNRSFRQNFDKRIAFQMGCIQLQSTDPSVHSPFHFTTLVDINTYIVGFYEFMMKKYMSILVDNLNIPYGKSAVDKLYSLQSEGFVIEESYNDMNNILGENHFVQYQREIMFTMRKCTEFQTSHNRAVFEAFTKCINVYRPYYDLEGEVFPWIVSEKGITFYQITQDNIEQVFQKSKIKVLQYCTALCGLHPPSQVKNQQQSTLMNQKNQQNLTKMIKTQTLQHFDEWKIRFVNFQCLIRILLADKIHSEIVNELVSQLSAIENSKIQR